MKQFLTTLLSSVTLLIVMTTGSAQAQVANQALSLDGTDDYVSVPYAAGLNPTGAFTVEAWVNVSKAGHVALVSTNPLGSTASGGMSVNLLSEGMVELDVIGAGFTQSSANAISRNAWHHVAVTFDPALSPTTRIYVDGSEVGTGTNGSPSDLGNPLLIGTRADNNLNLGGQIDELRLWDEARTAAQIASNRTKRLAGNEANLTAYFRFDVLRNLGISSDGTDDLTDHSGNERHADTANGPTLVDSTAPFTSGSVAATDDLFENQVEITWPAADAGSAKSVEITRDGQEIAVLASEDGRYFDRTGGVNQRVAYCVYEIDGGNSTLLGCDAGRRRLNPVTDLSASDRLFTDRVQLTWTDRSAHEDGFNVYRDNIAIASLNANVQSYSDTGASVGAVYTYCVVPTDGGLEGSARVCDQGAVGSVLPVASFSASDGTHPNDVLLTWADQGSGATGFEIFRDGVGIHVAAANATSYADGGASYGTVHTYCIARQEGGNSAEQVCDPGSVGTMQAPSQVTASFDDFDDRVEVGWRDNTDVENGFLVSRSSGAALQFDGTDDFVLVPDADALDLTSTYTIEAWIKPENVTSSQYIVSKDGVGSDRTGAYNFYLSSGELRLEINNTGEVSSNAVLTAGVWSHVAVTYDAAASPQVRFYVNGTPQGTADVAAPTVNDRDFLIGRRGVTNDSNFRGEIDEVRLWNVARTESQVQGTLFSGPGATPTGLVAHYAFDEGQGATAFDLFGRNEGTLTNFALSQGSPGWQAATAPITTYVTSLGMRFDGTEDFIRVPDAAALDVTATFTIEAWIWPENVTSSQYIVSKDGVGSDRTGAYNFYLSSGELRLEINNIAEVASRPRVPAQQWSHVAVTYDANASPQVRFYLNGAEYGTAALGTGPSINAQDLLIGRRGVTNDSNFRGRMDDVRLWNTARTTEEIADNRSAAPAPTTSGLVANWSMDGFAALGIANTDNNGASAFDDIRDATGNHPGDAEGGLAVVRGLATVITTTDQDAVSTSDFDAVPNVYQRYCVAAYTNQGVVTGTTCASGRRGGAAAPQNVAASDDQFEDRVVITWGNASTRNTFFNVYRNDALIGVTPVSTLTFTDQDIGSDIDYTYCVAAVSGEGVESPRACDTGRRRIAAATNVAASDAQFEDRVELTWTDNSSIERGYYVFRRVLNGDGSLASDSTRVDSTFANRTAAIDSLGVPGTRYRYSVIAFDQKGRAKAAFDNGRRVLNAPAALVAEDDVSETSIGLQWEDKSQAETGFIIYRENVEIARVGKNVVRYTDASPLTGQTVTYEVTAYEAYGTSERVSDTGQTALLTPGSVVASDTYNNRVSVSWVDQSVIETGYIVYRDGVEVTQVAAGETVFDDFNVPALNTVYQYCVATKGNGNNSEQVCDDGQAFAPPPDPTARPMELRLTASDAEADPEADLEEGDGFGTATAQTDTEIFVGAFGVDDRSGMVYRFENTDQGWVETETIFPAETLPDSDFGSAMDVDGNHLVIGAPRFSRGRVFLFRKNGNAWTEVNTLGSSLPHMFRMGFSVGIDGGWAVAGAPRADNDAGEIRFFRVTEDGLVDNLSGRSVHGSASFGYDVAIDGTRLVATMLNYNNTGNGRAYYYELEGNEWNEKGHVETPGSGAVGVALDGEWMAVGAESGDECGADYGSVRLFRQSGATWNHHADVCASDGFTGAGFGVSVELDGDLLAVGAYLGIGNGAQAAYLFKRQPDDTWVQVQKYTSDDPANSKAFGRRMSLNQGLLVAGDEFEAGTGAAYIEVFAPLAPQALAASDGEFEGRNALTWTDKSGNEAGFRIFRDGEVLTDVDPDITAYDDLSARPGDVHEYCVASFLVSQAGEETVDVLSAQSCDMGWRVPDGAIAGQILNSLGDGEADMQVCLAPSTNSSLLFDGIGGHVITDESFRLPDTFTIEFWARRSSIGTDDVLFSHGRDASAQGLFMGFRSTNVLQFGYSGNFFSTPAYTDTDWHHWAVLFDDASNISRIYRDGVEVASNTGSADYEATGRLILGTLYDGAGNPQTDGSWNLKGQIDEFRIWSDVRTPAEIMANKDKAINSSAPGLWAYFPLDERQTTASAEVINGTHHLRHAAGAAPAQPGAPLSSCAPTNSSGNYAFAGIRYGESTEFTLTPDDPNNANRVFVPAVKVLTLSEDSPVQNEINFTDATRYEVAGTITFEGTTCPATDVPLNLTVDGLGLADPTLTDSDGDFITSVDPGQLTLTPRIEGSDRVFQPASRTINVDRPISGLTFTDVTDRTISGAVFGGACRVPIGQATLRIRSENGCFEQTIQTDASGNYTIDVPPQPYTIELTDIANVSSPAMRVAILEYFEQEGPQTVDVTSADSTVNLVYRAPLVVTVNGLEPSVCDSPALPGNIPVLAKGDEIDISISVSEDYGNNQLCPIDSGSVTLYNEIADLAEAPITLNFTEDDGGKVDTTFTVGNPNLLQGRVVEGVDRTYQKFLTASASVGSQTKDATVWAAVSGNAPRPGGQFLTTPTIDLPMMVLRDPPGDNSFSYLERGSMKCNGFDAGATFELYNEGELALRFGTKVDVGAAFGGEASVELEGYNFIGAGFETSVAVMGGGGLTVCHGFADGLATSSDPGFVGPAGDLFVGNGVNFVFAPTDVLDIDTTSAECEINVSEALAFAPKFETNFVYTRDYIESSLIPSLRDKKEATSDDVKKETFQVGIERWQKYLNHADSLATNSTEPFKSDVTNQSFSGGAEVSYARTYEKEERATTGLDVTIGAYFFTGAFLDIVSNGFEAMLKVGTRLTASFLFEHSTTTESAIGYVLSDDDDGDAYTLDITRDDSYETPVFTPQAGFSSCPYEPWTGTSIIPGVPDGPRVAPRDLPTLSLDDASITDADPDKPAVFTLRLGNNSPSEEERTYRLYADQGANPGGALITANGESIGFDGQIFTVPYNQTQQITLAVERGPQNFSYQDLKVSAIPACELPVDGSDQAVSATFSVAFTAPCSNIDIFRPTENWRITRANEADPLEIILNEFSLETADTGAGVTEIGLEYRRVGEQNWNLGFTATPEDIRNAGSETNYTHNWAFSGPDGDYEIRAYTKCPAGTNYTLPVVGFVDTAAPVALEKPTPANGILTASDDISITFTEPVLCETVRSSGTFKNVQLTYLDGENAGNALPISTTCDGDKLVLSIDDSITLASLQGQRLEARLLSGVVDGNNTPVVITDVNGNGLTEDIAWAFTARYSPFFFEPVNMAVSLPRGTSETFSTALASLSTETETFQLVDVPDWLDVSVAANTNLTLPPGGTQPLTFTIPDTLIVGTRVDTVTVRSSQGDVLFFPTVTVTEPIPVCTPPDWVTQAFDPTLFSHQMMVYGQIRIDNAISTEVTGDMLGAFVNGELRGRAAVTLDAGSGNHAAVVSVRSHLPVGETVRFQVYDKSECLGYPNTDQVLAFGAQSQGSMAQPVIMNAGNRPPLQAVALNEGWTWFSLNRRPADRSANAVLESLTVTSGDLIKSQTAFSLYTPAAGGWVGSLQLLDPASAYQVKLAQESALVIEGAPIDVAATPLTLVPGWNWVSYLPQAAQSVTDALATLAPQDGDMIKSQTDGFAQYSSGAWVGTLTQLEPGKGYLVNTQNGGTLTYPYVAPATAQAPVLAKATDETIDDTALASDALALAEKAATAPAESLRDEVLGDGSAGAIDKVDATTEAAEVASVTLPAVDEHWAFEKHAFPYSMTLTGALEQDDELVDEDGLVVVAMAGQEVRGHTTLRAVRTLDGMAHRFFLTVYGSGAPDEAFRLEVYRNGEEPELIGLSDTDMLFSVNAHEGTVFQPKLLVLDNAAVEEVSEMPTAYALEQNYPNPFNPETVVRYALPESAPVRLTVVDVLGREVMTLVQQNQSAGFHTVTIDGRELASGVYFYVLKTPNFHQMHRMVLVK